MNNLEKVLDILENQMVDINVEFRNINIGGCGAMAKIIADQLDLLGMEYEVACLMSNNDTFTCEEVNGIMDMMEIDSTDYWGDIPNNHIVIRFDGRYWDSDGEYTITHRKVAALIDNPTITRMVAVEDFWCNCFKRGQIGGMEAFTKNLFKPLLEVA